MNKSIYPYYFSLGAILLYVLLFVLPGFIEQKQFFETYGKKQGTVYQTAVKYMVPQWMDMGKDISAIFGGQMQPKD